ncbi:YqaJ-like recombinase domain-containing protein [Oryzisolibacter propanilivorax]|uniref:YqaJ-like recombinase domain-containing protein n=1 Tax=Oryzisolibacter propanilivorax TaxID=1527607 RepID=A0A1G9SKP6_9BURK|nr:YqaJ viral recombinase family protein [Oryzisolibacter propanilivorax]SDM35991.1 YqaJ-like recombinase domain-containing protein [Oryzisolibacter propanilivorax]
MTMEILYLQQGTAEWHQHRATSLNASDAPAMLACSPHKSRAELVRERATGITPEVGAATARRFADGHRFENLARPLAEDVIGEDLSPCVGKAGR